MVFYKVLVNLQALKGLKMNLKVCLWCVLTRDFVDYATRVYAMDTVTQSKQYKQSKHLLSQPSLLGSLKLESNSPNTLNEDPKVNSKAKTKHTSNGILNIPSNLKQTLNSSNRHDNASKISTPSLFNVPNRISNEDEWIKSMRERIEKLLRFVVLC